MNWALSESAPDLGDMIRKIAESSDYNSGSRRMQKSLSALSFPVGRWKIALLMKEAGVWVVIKRNKMMTDSGHKKLVDKKPT